MSFLGPNNALAWAHFRLRGGWVRSLLFTTAAVMILGMVMIGTLHFDRPDIRRNLMSWSAGLLGFQAAILVLYIPIRISAAIRNDIQTKLIESHRLMPTTPLEAIAGYISGAALQALVLSAALFVVGAITCAGAGLDLAHWAVIHVVLLAFAIFVWTLAAYASFLTKVGPALFLVPFFLGPLLTEGGALAALPGAMLMLNPLIGHSIFDLRNTGVALPPTYALAMAAEGFFAVIFFIAAARKYRRADGVGIDTLLAMLLVAGWTAITCVGMQSWNDLRMLTGRRVDDPDAGLQFASSILVGLVLSLIVVAASAWAVRVWRQRRAADPSSINRKPIAPLLLIAIATFIILIIPFANSPSNPSFRIDVLRSAIIIAVAMMAVYFLCAWVYFAYPKAGVAIFIWILLAWGGPILFDLIRIGLAQSGEVEKLSGPASCSPVGALIEIWNHYEIDTTPGIIMQALIASIPLALWLMIVSKRRGK